MKYCSECKVFVNENLKNCPLCGSWTEECESNRFEDYAEQEKYVSYAYRYSCMRAYKRAFDAVEFVVGLRCVRRHDGIFVCFVHDLQKAQILFAFACAGNSFAAYACLLGYHSKL